MHEPLENRTYIGKKLFNFLGADFLAPKNGHQREKQPVLGRAHLKKPRSLSKRFP